VRLRFRSRSMVAAALAATVAACAAALPGSAGAKAEDTITVVTNTATPALAVFLANDRGWFEQAGLHVKVLVVASGSAAMQGVIGGAAQIAFTNPLTLTDAVAKGIKLQAVAPGGEYDHSQPNSFLLVLPGSPIKTVPDLDGKTVAVTGLDDLLSLGLKSLVDKLGGHSSSIHFVEVPPSTMYAALKEHRVEAAVDYDPFASAMVDQGAHSIGLPLDGIAPVFDGAMYVASTPWLSAHRDEAATFAQVMHDASVYATAHFSELIPFISKYSKLPVATLQKIAPETYPPGMYPDLLQPVIDVAVKYEHIKPFPASSEIFDIPLNVRPPK
jgi:ABC-type nitrate/sulfonate/bicarbonate transport system substrate-binding protein